MRPAGDWRTPPEIIASEQRILTLADAVLTWMRNVEWKPGEAEQIDGFFTHQAPNPFLNEPGEGHEYEPVRAWVLEKMDRDTNRLVLDLLRAAWERRCWQVRYGMRTTVYTGEDGKLGP